MLRGWFAPSKPRCRRFTFRNYYCDTVVSEAYDSDFAQACDDLVESLTEEAEQADVSWSEYIRDTLKSHHDTDALREELDELQSAYDDLEAERDRLQR